MKYTRTQWDERSFSIPITQWWNPKDLTNSEVTLVIDWKWSRLEEVNNPEDHIDPKNWRTLFQIPEHETSWMEPWEYKIYLKVKDKDGWKLTTSRKDLEILPD